ncbi:MAG: RNA polymerase subunit sigma [Verrucomicrobiae bacterium]|nr:RNA polymerase subunit sigma [Verrucomicrobiae bacterium]
MREKHQVEDDAEARKRFDKLTEHFYQELRGLAHQMMFSKPDGHTLQPTALLHEAYLRVRHRPDGVERPWVNRAYFVGSIAEAMRRIIIEDARRKKSLRRGGGFVRVALEDVRVPADADPGLLLSLDEAITRLEAVHPDKAEVVRLLFFGGLTANEAAEVLGLTDRTVKRHWAFARAWLYEELQR